MTAPFRPRTATTAQAARLRKLPAYGPGPSLFRDHPVSVRQAMASETASLIASMTASWAARTAAGEYPVIVPGRGVEWRRQEVAA